MGKERPPVGFEPATCGLQNRGDDSDKSDVSAANKGVTAKGPNDRDGVSADCLLFLAQNDPQFRRIAEVWEALTDDQRARVMEIIEGKGGEG